MIDEKKIVIKMIQEIHAVVLLEYLDKNLLSGDNATRNEWVRGRLLECITSIESNLENYDIS